MHRQAPTTLGENSISWSEGRLDTDPFPRFATPHQILRATSSTQHWLSARKGLLVRYTTRPVLAEEPSRKMVKNKVLMLYVWFVAAMCTRYLYKYSWPIHMQVIRGHMSCSFHDTTGLHFSRRYDWLYFPAIIQ